MALSGWFPTVYGQAASSESLPLRILTPPLPAALRSASVPHTPGDSVVRTKATGTGETQTSPIPKYL